VKSCSKTNRHCLPLFLLEEGYRQFLMSGLGEMVFRTLRGLVNDWRETAEFDLIRLRLRLFAERLRLLGVFLKSGDPFTTSDRAALEQCGSVSRHTVSQMTAFEPAQSERAP
jgi:hypothetical protein